MHFSIANVPGLDGGNFESGSAKTLNSFIVSPVARWILPSKLQVRAATGLLGNLCTGFQHPAPWSSLCPKARRSRRAFS